MLENRSVQNSLTSLGDGAFAECTNVSSIMLPNGVTRIGGQAPMWSVFRDELDAWRKSFSGATAVR